MKQIVSILTLLLALSAAGPTASAEVFLLANGGQLVGELMNRDESPRRSYVIQPARGAKITLDTAQVKKVLSLRPKQIEYERIRPTYPDTAAGQWELAQWCRDHRLTAEREIHLRRVIELDPNHAQARLLLGYSLVGGQWTTHKETMIRRGYVRYKGQWKLPQEVELAETKRKQEAAQQEWFQKVRRWRGWLGTDRDRQACDNIRGISDPVR